MATMKDILAIKGPRIVTISPEATVRAAAQVMEQHQIGAVLVMENERIVGMFSERDVLQKVVAVGRDPIHMRVAEAMTTGVVCCTPATSLEEARLAMKDRRIRHLPVVADGQILGLVSIGDLNAFLAANQEQTISLLHEYLYGRV